MGGGALGFDFGLHCLRCRGFAAWWFNTFCFSFKVVSLSLFGVVRVV